MSDNLIDGERRIGDAATPARAATMPEPGEFARSWIAAWNARDVEAVLSHFRDDAVFSSPIALRLGHGERGTIRGKDAIRRYWADALALNPALHFRLDAIYAGTDAVAIAFTNQEGVSRVETLVFEGGLVSSGHGMMPWPHSRSSDQGHEQEAG